MLLILLLNWFKKVIFIIRIKWLIKRDELVLLMLL